MVSFLGGGYRTGDGPDAGSAGVPEHVERRPATRSGHLATATVACARCDAPVAVGPGPRRVTDVLVCPFCRRRGPLREFLSLSAPARPARVEVRVSFGGLG